MKFQDSYCDHNDIFMQQFNELANYLHIKFRKKGLKPLTHLLIQQIGTITSKKDTLLKRGQTNYVSCVIELSTKVDGSFLDIFANHKRCDLVSYPYMFSINWK